MAFNRAGALKELIDHSFLEEQETIKLFPEIPAEGIQAYYRSYRMHLKELI